MLYYKLIERNDINPNAEEGARKFYPVLRPGTRISFDTLCDEATEESALTSADFKSCMDRLIRSLTKHLAEGDTVDCGDLGSFRINLCSRGADSEEAYDANAMMRPPRIQYYPGKLLRQLRESPLRYKRVGTKKKRG